MVMRVLLLIFATMIWGFGFVATRWTLLFLDPGWSNTLRFVFAGLMATPILFWKKKITFSFPIFFCSFLLFVGLYLQTVGIGGTTLAKSGFLTIFYAVFTPILMRVIYCKKFHFFYWFLLGMAILGIALMSGVNWQNIHKGGFSWGDGCVLGSAFFFACHILAVDKWGFQSQPIIFNLQQCFYIGSMSLLVSLFFTDVPDLSFLFHFRSFLPPGVGAGLLFLSLFSSIGAFSIQIYAQQKIPPQVVSLVFMAEAIFSALFGYWFFAESLNFFNILGAGLVLMSVSLVPFFTLKE